MKFITFGVFIFALTFCGISDKLKEFTSKSGTNSSTNSSANSSANSAANSSNTAKTNSSSSSGDKADKASLTPEQQATLDGGSDVVWDDQGVTWKLPKGWKKMDVKKETFNYSSADNAFLLVNISLMSSDFPVDASLKATYDSSLQQLKNGKYESAKYVEIDGIKGVEFVEAPPEDKDGPRRHQWIAFRNYQGQVQQLNVMLSTKGTNFDKHKDDFPAILYAMKISK